MDRIVVAVAIGTALVFGTGVMAGVIAMVAMAIRKEDRLRSLTRQPPSAAARGSRRLNGVGGAGPGQFQAQRAPPAGGAAARPKFSRGHRCSAAYDVATPGGGQPRPPDLKLLAGCPAPAPGLPDLAGL